MLKPQTKIKQKGTRLLNQSDFSKKKLITFAATFAVIGSYFIWQTFATATINCVRFSGDSCLTSTIVCNETSKSGFDGLQTNDTTPTFAIDTDGTTAQYQYSIDGVSKGNVSANGLNFACVTSPDSLAEGAHTFVANELQPDNTKTTVPNPFSFKVDTSAPAAPSTPVLEPFDDSGVQGDNITASSTPDFKGFIEPSAMIELYAQGIGRVGNNFDTSSGNWSLGSRSISPDGTYTFYAKAQDGAGNESSASGNVAITIDSTLPDATISAPSPINNSALLQVKNSSGNNASDNLSGMWKVWYRYRLNANSPWNDIGTATSSPFSLNWNTSNLASGSYLVTAFAYDIAGNFRQTTTNVTLANTTPVINISNPFDQDYVKGTVSVSADATATAPSASISKVEFYVDGALKATDTSSPYAFNWNTTNLSNAVHALVAKAYDNASPVNVGTSQAVAVTVDNVAPSKPTFVTAKPAPFTQMYVSWTQATDNIGIAYYDVWADGEQNNTVAPDECVTSNCSVFFDFNEAGVSHSFYVKAVDFAGNINTSTTVSGTTSDDINVAYLDDGTCGRDVRKNGDPGITNVSNPSFYVTGDGINASYSLEVTRWNGSDWDPVYSGGTSTNLGNGKYCLSLPSNINLSDGQEYNMFANEITPTTDFGSTGAVFTVSLSSVPGDANGDGHVTIIDLSILLSNFSSTTNTAADFNHDGVVNIIDLSILLSHYGT